MQNTNPAHVIHPDVVSLHDKDIPPEERNILAAVPSESREQVISRGDLHPETYRQALKMILGTPELESRLNYITAVMITTIFGGWLVGKAVKSRTFRLGIDLLVVFVISVLIGSIIGILLGEGFLPLNNVRVFLLVALGILSFVFGIFVASISTIPIPKNQERARPTMTRSMPATARAQMTAPRRISATRTNSQSRRG